MTSYFTLLSTAQIGHDDWRGFLQAVRAERIDKPHNPYEGALMSEQGKIWVGMDNGVVEDIDLDDRQLVLMLGGEPVTAIVVEAGSTPESKQLALEFAGRFAERWPCVVQAEDRLYSSAELLALQQPGRTFLSSDGQ